jgi:hypothetical protein
MEERVMSERASSAWKYLVRGAEIDCEYLDDLTIMGIQKTGHTNQDDWDGPIPLHAKDTEGPKRKVPGLQIDGYFLDDHSSTTRAPQNSYGNKMYPHDSQFVIRFPADWNRKLVVTSAPGLRAQYANDFIIGDFVLDKGYAFASTDKGNSGLRFYSADQTPGEAVFEWHRRINQLTEAAKDAAEKYYGESPYRTYITGNSNAGYVTRYALENHPDLYDGGVDWQGPLWTDPESPNSDPDKGPNLLTFLPVALKNYPRYIEPSISDAGRDDARDKMIEAGFAEGSEFLWRFHYDVYWNSTEWVFREEFDPYYPGASADYNYEKRINPSPQAPELARKQAQEIKDAVKRVSLTGDIKKPLLTLHGTLDALLPITKTSDKYAELVEKAGHSDLHRYYRIEGGTHVDSLYDSFPDKLRPMLPCYKAAFDRLVEWVEDRVSPPDNQTVPKPEGDVVNSCSEL